VFEQIRRSLEELLQGATKPEERHLVFSRMKDTLVQATMGVNDLRDGLALTRRKLEGEQRDLAVVRRRKELATGIQDAETIAIAERFERQHAERAAVLEEKVAIQTRELDLAERELGEMKAELRTAMAGAPGPRGGPLNPAADEADPLAEESGAKVREEIDSLARERARADRNADADRRLEELKKSMGKKE
jgi:hypothetical protein